MKIKIELLSDTIFGSGISVPGGEDISVLYDDKGFPYLKASTFRGVFKEEYINYLNWVGKSKDNIKLTIENLFGDSGYSNDEGLDNITEEHDKKLKFSDFCISDNVKKMILSTENIKKDETLDALTYMRAFTSIDEDGISKEGSLRSARCIKKHLSFYGNIELDKAHEEEIKKVLKCVKWLGSMRTRGFGRVKISVVGGEN